MIMYDIHSHLGKTSSGEENSPSEIVNYLKGFQITKVGISCLSGNNTRNQNDLIHKAVLEYPENIIGYGFINPKDENAFNEIDKCLGEYKFKGIKFHSWKHGYYPDNVPIMDDILKKIEKYGVHIQTHVGTAPLSTPYVWADYAKKHPNLRFLFTHIGYYEFGLSTIEAIKNLDNVWIETSGQFDVFVLKKAIQTIGADRICFGTDWPYKPVNIEISKLYKLGLSNVELEKIFYKNAEKLWNLQ